MRQLGGIHRLLVAISRRARGTLAQRSVGSIVRHAPVNARTVSAHIHLRYHRPRERIRSSTAAGHRAPENREPLGSKKKLWFRDPMGTEPRVLFKYNRADTGEDWSEKVASELAQLLGLPHAPGSSSPNSNHVVVQRSWTSLKTAVSCSSTGTSFWNSRTRNLQPSSEGTPSSTRFKRFCRFLRARLCGVPDAVPNRLMTRAAKDFACALLECNAKLLGVR